MVISKSSPKLSTTAFVSSLMEYSFCCVRSTVRFTLDAIAVSIRLSAIITAIKETVKITEREPYLTFFDFSILRTFIFFLPL